MTQPKRVPCTLGQIETGKLELVVSSLGAGTKVNKITFNTLVFEPVGVLCQANVVV